MVKRNRERLENQGVTLSGRMTLSSTEMRVSETAINSSCLLLFTMT